MHLGDIMTTDVEVTAPDVNARAALARMRSANIHHLVVGTKRSVLGVLSYGDLGKGKAQPSPDATVADLMSEGPICADRETTVQKAANMMRGHSIGCLPILDGGKLVGIVTTSDLLELVGRGPQPKPNGRPDKGPHRHTSRLPPRNGHNNAAR